MGVALSRFLSRSSQRVPYGSPSVLGKLRGAIEYSGDVYPRMQDAGTDVIDSEGGSPEVEPACSPSTWAPNVSDEWDRNSG